MAGVGQKYGISGSQYAGWTFAGGVALPQGAFVTGSSLSGITAGTTRTQAGATGLSQEVNRVDTATAPAAGSTLGDGVRLMPAVAGLTGRANYARAGIVDDPDRALDPGVAAAVLEQGLREGWFTGRRLMDVLPLGGPATRAQFTAARRVVNGQDCAGLIADYALRFQDALLAGGCA